LTGTGVGVAAAWAFATGVRATPDPASHKPITANAHTSEIRTSFFMALLLVTQMKPNNPL
jgi:hypothetical protein